MIQKDKLTNIEFSIMIFFSVVSLFNGLGIYNIIKISKVDAYISVLLSFLFSIPIFGIFLYIFNYKKGLNIKEKNKYLFGNIFGTIINYIIIILYGIISFTLLFNISNFAISQFLSETPIFIFMILVSIIVVYNISKGIHNIYRVGVIFFVCFVVLTIISSVGILPDIDSSNLKPVLAFGFSSPIKGAIILTLSNVSPIFCLLNIRKNNIKNNSETNKYLLIFFTVAFIFEFIAIFLTIASLGIHLATVYQYPEYTMLKKIKFFNFIDRIENFIYVKWILSSVISLSIINNYISDCIYEKSKYIVPLIVMIISTFLSIIIFKNNTIFYKFVLDILPYFNIFLLTVYVIIFLNILIRKILLNEK